MNSMMLKRTNAEGCARETLQRICEWGITQPAGIWERLESEGIRVTPGVLHQGISELMNQQATRDQDGIQKASGEREKGVSLQDVATLVLLAEKAGGARPLIRLLRRVQRAST